MKPDRWQKLDHLFHAASEREPKTRAAFLDEACAGDEDLRRKVEALLAAHEEAGSFIENKAVDVEAQAMAENQTSEPTTLLSGQTISHYRIIRKLGAGAMGEVYLAQDTTLRRNVALKLLPALFTSDPERLRRFEQEARAASALNHPNILTIYEIGEADSIRYIAGEFVDGVTLREFMQSRPTSIASTLDITIQIAAALAAAHAKGIVHRDIKPENIMISRGETLSSDSNVKVLDFGIAKLTEAEGLETELPTRPIVSTSEGLTMGTVPYMSPEQAQGAKVDGRTDIWSLGVVLYEMLAGRIPFDGPTRSHVMVSILEREPTPLRELTNVPESLEWIVSKALRKNQDDRYQTARELHSDLKDFRQRFQQVGWTPSATSDARDAAQAAVGDPATLRLRNGDAAGVATGATSAPRVSSRRWIALSVALLLLVVSGLALKFAWPRLTTKNAATPFNNFKVNRLTTTGKASSAAISPDGKYVVHVKAIAGQYSLWLKHIATGSDKEIVSSDGSEIDSLSFSPDGNHIYFIRTGNESVLNEIPVLGGPSKQLVTDIDTAATFSPDGKKLAFIRGDPTRDEASLIVANADGTGEVKVVTDFMAEFFGPLVASPAWSADGESIAFARVKTEANTRYANLATVRVRDGLETKLTSQKVSDIEAICWKQDGTGLFFTAAESQRSNAQIWFASYPAGETKRITNDPLNYQNLTITADGKSLATVMSEGTSDVWVMPEGDSGAATQITSSRFDGIAGIAWTPDGRIVHVSRVTGNPNVWIMNADGSGDQQLTSNSGLNTFPSVTPDGRYVVYMSNNTGLNNIWRMDLDGKHQMQLTTGVNDTEPVCSPDSKWVIFTSGGEKKNTLWKVPIEGGSPTQLTDSNAMHAAISPKDGSITYFFVDLQHTPVRFRNAVMAPEGEGARLKVFDFPMFFGTLGPGTYTQEVRWMADGKAFSYIDNKDAAGNMWSQPIDGGPPKQLTNFKSDLIFYYAWSPDGKKLALARGSKTSDVVIIREGTAP